MRQSMNQAKRRWEVFANIIRQVIPNHKYDHFNMISQMNRRELREFINDNSYAFNLKTNSRLSAENAQILSMITYAKNLLRLRGVS